MGIIQTAKTAKDVIRYTEKVFCAISCIMLLVIMFLGASDVIGRYVFNRPITGASDINQILMGGMVFLGWAYVYYKKGHISVDIILFLYPPQMRIVFALLMTFITLVLFGFILWQSVLITISDWQTGREVSIINIPIAPFKALVSLGALLLCLECIIQMVQYASTLISGRRV